MSQGEEIEVGGDRVELQNGHMWFMISRSLGWWGFLYECYQDLG